MCYTRSTAATPVVIDCPMTAVEVVAARVDVGRFAMVVVVVYRPGSDAVQSTFYDELASVFETVATYQIPVYVVGDFNVRFDRLNDPHTCQLLDLVRSYGFDVRSTTATHRQVERLTPSSRVRTYLDRSFDRSMLVYLTTICWNGQFALNARKVMLLGFQYVHGVSSTSTDSVLRF
jgi:hypothetical protein